MDNPNVAIDNVDIAVLSQLMTAEAVLYTLPTLTRIGEFVARVLEYMPSIQKCAVCIYGQHEPFGSLQVNCRKICRQPDPSCDQPVPYVCIPDKDKQMASFPLATGQLRFGQIVIVTDQPEILETHKPFISNFINLTTLVIENKWNESLLKSANEELAKHKIILEDQVEARTSELVTANRHLNASNQELKANEQQLRTANQELEKEKGRLAKAQEIGTIGTWELDPVENVLTWTKENHNIFGIPDGTELTYETFLACVHPDDRECVNTKWRAAVDGKPYDFEHRIIANGKVKWVREKAELSFDNKGKVVRAVGVTQDITNRRQAEEELLQSEERFRRAILDSPFPIMIHAEDGEVIQINKVWTELTGYEADEIPTLSAWTERAYGERKDVIKSRIDRIFDCDTKVEEGEYSIFSRDGKTLIWDSSSAPLGTLPDGRRLVISMAMDITERKQAEKEAIRNTHLTQILLDSMPCIALLLKPKTREIMALNETAFRAGARLGQTCFCSWAKRDEYCPFCMAPELWESGEAQYKQLEYGGVFWDAHWLPISEDLYMHYAFDITERKQSEEKERRRQAKLSHASRLSSMGEMASGLAHEINQPLCAITSFADASVRMFESKRFKHRDILESMQSVSTQARRVGEIIKNMRAFVSKEPAGLSIIDICEVISDSVNLVRGQIKQGQAKVRLELPDESLTATANKVQIEQVLINLIQNSLDAMDQTDIGGREILISASKTDDEMILVSVVDSGKGFGDVNPSQMFDQFFTTKEEGMGIGLSINTSIVEEHGGKLWAESNENGATFKFTIPINGKEES